MGWTIAVQLSLEGFSGVPLLLTWTLDGTDVPETWASENLAYRVVASTAKDTGTAEVWVPDLAAPGNYRVNVRLSLESNGTTVAYGGIDLPGD